MRVDMGLEALESLLKNLRPNGIGVVHLPFKNSGNLMDRAGRWILNNVPLAHIAANVVRKRALRTPKMRMHCYPMNSILALLSRFECNRVYTEIINYELYQSVALVFQKGQSAVIR